MRAPPDRASTIKGSRFYYNGTRRLRISIDGVEHFDSVTEYCVSKGWASVHVLVDGKKQPGAWGSGWRTRMVHGRIVVWWADAPIPVGALTPEAKAA